MIKAFGESITVVKNGEVGTGIYNGDPAMLGERGTINAQEAMLTVLTEDNARLDIQNGDLVTVRGSNRRAIAPDFNGETGWINFTLAPVQS